MKKTVFPLILGLLFWLGCDSGKSSGGHSGPVEMAAMTESGPDAEHTAELWAAVSPEENMPGSSSDYALLEGDFRISGLDGGYYFSVHLQQKGDSLIGSYCGGNDNRSDCGMESQGVPDCQIRGIVRGNTGFLAFRSCYTGGIGTANIYLEGKHLRWETTENPPNPGDGMYYCAAPGNRLLKNEAVKITYNKPARFADFSTSTTGFLTDMIPADTHYVFHPAKVYHETSGQQFKTRLYPGKAIRILREASTYGIARHGDEVFEAPVYEVAYEEYGQERKGFMYHEDIALTAFRDDRGNLFLFGVEVFNEGNEPGDVSWKVIGESFGSTDLEGVIPTLRKRNSSEFPAFDCQIKTRPDLAQREMSFIELRMHTQGYEGYEFQTILAWNGKKLKYLLEPQPTMIPYGVQAAKTDQGIRVSYHTLSSDKGGIASRDFILQGDSILAPSHEPLSGLSLAFTGENDENSFSDEYKTLSWLGVRNTDSLLVIEPVNVQVENRDMGEDSDGGRIIMREISVAGDNPYQFLISGKTFTPGAAGSFPVSELRANSEVPFNFPGSDWKFISTGWEEEYAPINLGMFLVGTRDGKKLEQLINFESFREDPVKLIWCGDLDGDQQPDFIIDVAIKGFYTTTELYLSGLAGEGQLVGYAGEFPGIEPGS